MKKVIYFLAAGTFLLAMHSLQARDHVRSWSSWSRHAGDTLRQTRDTGRQQAPEVREVPDTGPILPEDTSLRILDSAIATGRMPVDTTGRVRDSVSSNRDSSKTLPVQDSAKTAAVQDRLPGKTGSGVADGQTEKPADNAADKLADSKPVEKSKPAQDSVPQDQAYKRGELDTRWFISPLLKFQFQDFGMLEKNRKGYLSNANSLPFDQRGNGSFAASAYKNITKRLSVSADIGLSFGHVTNDDVLIGQTARKTYNLLNATVYYHLLGPSYHLQPYISVGINDLINDESYLTAPVGLGAKFNGRKIMVMGQISYGAAVSKNVSNTTMYSLGIYLPIKNKKKNKQLEKDDQSPYNRSGKDDEKDKDKKKNDKDSTNKSGGVVNNIYITIKMDSVLKARGLLDDDGDGSGSGLRRRRKGGNGGGYGDGDGDSDVEAREAFRDVDLNDFGTGDFKIDRIDGHPVIRFVVYFEFNEYSLNSRAFGSIDKVISHIRKAQNIYIEIKGYTDDVGTDPYNNFLSRRRANMVRDYMNSRGISAELMKAKAYGKDNPVASNSDPNTAWLNRRAEIIIRLK